MGEGDGLENRCTGFPVPRVQIPASPDITEYRIQIKNWFLIYKNSVINDNPL